MKVEMELPDELFADWGGEAEAVRRRLQLEFALHLYASHEVSAGRAAEIAGVRRATFEEALCSSGILRNYRVDDLAHDLAWAKSNSS